MFAFKQRFIEFLNINELDWVFKFTASLVKSDLVCHCSDKHLVVFGSSKANRGLKWKRNEDAETWNLDDGITLAAFSPTFEPNRMADMTRKNFLGRMVWVGRLAEFCYLAWRLNNGQNQEMNLHQRLLAWRIDGTCVGSCQEWMKDPGQPILARHMPHYGFSLTTLLTRESILEYLIIFWN